MTNRVLKCIVTVGLLTGLTAAQAVLINIQPGGAAGKDAQISDDVTANTNFGTNQRLIINWSGNFRSIGLVEFDLSGIPTGATINSATLDLFHSLNGNLNRRYDVFRTTSSWSEGTVTFNTAPTFAATAVASLVILDNNTEVHRQWDVTNTVSNWVDGTFTNFGFWVEEIPVQGLGSAYFESSDTATASERPLLIVDYSIPEPYTLALMVLGLAGLRYSKRKSF